MAKEWPNTLFNLNVFKLILIVNEYLKAERVKHDSAIDYFKSSVANAAADKDEKKSASASTKVGT